jgi:hypothetical protein
MMKLLFLTLMLSMALPACTKDYEEDLGGGLCTTENMSLQTDIRPILQNNCMGCHSSAAAFGDVKLETYTDLKSWVDNGLFLGSIVHDGSASPMPKSQPKLGQCQIDKISAWIAQGAQDN